MKIALFSDIHANLPAFDALLADLDLQHPDSVFCLGDLTGYHIWPNEIIDEIRKRRITTLAGNHDLKTKGYAYELVTKDNRSYLATLPAHYKLEFKNNRGNLAIFLAHGSPRSIDEYVLEETDQAYVLSLMEEKEADILLVGHSHKPYHRIIESATGQFKHVINCGSVGKPKDGNPQGCYVLLTINENSSLTDKDSVRVEFVRFDYDLEKAAQAIEDSPLPIELASRLRNAY